MTDDGRPLPSGIAWEVDRLPSEAEGGIVGLLLNDPGGRGPGRRRPRVPTPLTPGTTRGRSVRDGRRRAASEVPGSGLARLTEMLDHLPEEPPKRLTPDDVDVDAPVAGPSGVWFWGDDDIYPGKVPGASEARHTARHRGVAKRRSPR